MSLFKELAKKLIDKNPPEPPRDYDVDKLKQKSSLPPKREPCVEHHWDLPWDDNRCVYCQMKYSYWLDVKRAIDRGDAKFEDWSCKPHYHDSTPATEEKA